MATVEVAWPKWEDPAFYVQDAEAIQASMAEQRRGAPVYWYEAPGLTSGFWVLSKWEDVRYVGSHPELFCNRYGFLIGDLSEPRTVWQQLPAWAQEEIGKPGVTPAQVRGLIARGKLSLGDPTLENMIFLDPPRHGQVRSIFMKALRPSLVRSLKGRIAEMTDEFLDRIEPGEEIDFTKTVGRIPAHLMTEMIGVPSDMRERFIELAQNHLAAITVTPDKDPEEVARIQAMEAELHDYCDGLLEERRASGGEGDDLISAIVSSELDGGPVPRSLAFVVHHALHRGRRDDARPALALDHGAREPSRPAAAAGRAPRADRERDRGDPALLPGQLERRPDVDRRTSRSAARRSPRTTSC